MPPRRSESRFAISVGLLSGAAGATRHAFAPDEARRLIGDEAEIIRTLADVEATAARGIRGVPVFIVNGRRVLAGAQPVDVLREAIAEAIR